MSLPFRKTKKAIRENFGQKDGSEGEEDEASRQDGGSEFGQEGEDDEESGWGSGRVGERERGGRDCGGSYWEWERGGGLKWGVRRLGRYELVSRCGKGGDVVCCMESIVCRYTIHRHFPGDRYLHTNNPVTYSNPWKRQGFSERSDISNKAFFWIQITNRITWESYLSFPLPKFSLDSSVQTASTKIFPCFQQIASNPGFLLLDILCHFHLQSYYLPIEP